MKICDRNIHTVTETHSPATLSSMNVSHIRGVEPRKPELAECTPRDSFLSSVTTEHIQTARCPLRQWLPWD